MVKSIVIRTMVALLTVMAAPAAWSQSAGWQAKWESTLAAAKKEGKLVVVGSPDPVMKSEVIPKFTERYGITIDFIAGSSSQIVGRVKTERMSAIYSVDVFMSGASTTMNVLYGEKLIDPIKPMLIRPDVTEGKYWKGGKPSFADKEQQYVFMPFSRVDDLLFINAAHVKPEEIRNYKDLLDPKWQGRIASEDPTINGRGNSRAIQLYAQFGPDFIKKLFIDQKPAISRDRRQITDWLARGSHPICLTCRVDDAAALQKEGYKLVAVYDLADTKNLVNSAPFLVTVANKAPHPNAATVFINWLASKEALELYSRGYSTATLRTDVDESFLDPRLIPKPGVEYQNEMDLQTVGADRRDASKEIREVLRDIKK